MTTKQTKRLQITPLHSMRMKYSELPKNYQEAVKICTDTVDFHQLGIERDGMVTMIKLSSDDVKRLLEHWNWAEPADESDIRRIDEIMLLIPSEGQWPYVSYWASTLDELTEIETWEADKPNPEWEFHNHGDGWHRMIASLRLGMPTMNFLFLEF